jgi:hypothetical protein
MSKISMSATVAAVGLAFVLAAPADADAQVCIGFPTTGGQMAAAFTANFPTGGNTFGGEFNYNFPGPGSVFAGIATQSPENEETRTSVGGGASFELAALTAALPAGISACPVLAVSATFQGDDTWTSFPIGVGFGATLPLGEAGLSLSPYVVPQFVIRTGDNSSNDFFLEGGALLNITPSIYAGATVNRLFIDGQKSELGLKIGVVF